MNNLVGTCFRRNLAAHLHRLAKGETLCVRNFGLMVSRRTELYSQKPSVLYLRLCQYSSSSTPTSVPPQPPPSEVSKDKKEKEGFWHKYRPAHYKDETDKEERLTEQMLVEAAYTKNEVPMTFQEKVKENTRTAGYTLVITMGFCVLVTLCWAVYNELFNRDSPNNIYAKTFKIVKRNNEIVDALGLPLICHGEETRPGWRRHVLHATFTHPDGSKRLRMKFYVKGKFRSGTVYLEKIANEKGRFDKYSYLYVELTGYPPRTIVINTEDL